MKGSGRYPFLVAKVLVAGARGALRIAIRPDLSITSLKRISISTSPWASPRRFSSAKARTSAPELSDQDITRILDHCHQYPRHTFWVQSKNPGRLLSFTGHGIWEHAYIGTTLESDLELGSQYMGYAPSRADRVMAMQTIAASGIKTYTTLEPLMKFSSTENFAAMVKQCHPEFVFIGRESMRRLELPEPFRYEVFALRAEIEKFTRVIMKENAQVWM